MLNLFFWMKIFLLFLKLELILYVLILFPFSSKYFLIFLLLFFQMCCISKYLKNSQPCFFFVVVVVSNLILVYLKNILSITLILLSLSLVSWCSSCHILKNISCALGKATNYVCCILQMRIKLVNSSSLLYPCLLLKCSCFSNYWEFGIDIFDLSVLLVDNMHWMLHFHLAFWLDD